MTNTGYDKAAVAVLMVLVAVNAWDQFLYLGQQPYAVVAAVLVIALLWRRQAPALIGASVAAGSVALIVGGFQSPWVPLLVTGVAVYTLAKLWKPAWAAAAGFLVIVVLNTTAFTGTFAPSPVFSIPASLLIAGSWVAGLLTSALDDSRQRGDQLERQSEEQRQERFALEERARLARELHDAVAHHVTLMVVQAESAPDLVRLGADRTLAAMRQIADSGRRALAELDLVLAALRDADDLAERAPIPNLADLDALVANARSEGLTVTLTTTGDPRPADEATALALYRVTQEALTNAIRHAGATDVTVSLTYQPVTVMVEVADNGTGLPDGAVPGSGISGMRERARLLGGAVTVTGAPGQGTTVTAQLPLGPAGALVP